MTGRELREAADRQGILTVVEQNGRELAVEIPLDREFLAVPLSELNLSVRAYNGLMRAKIDTIDKLSETIMSEGGLQGIRNLGKTSIYEIKTVLLSESYNRLSDGMKTEFWGRVAEVNGL